MAFNEGTVLLYAFQLLYCEACYEGLQNLDALFFMSIPITVLSAVTKPAWSGHGNQLLTETSKL